MRVSSELHVIGRSEVKNFSAGLLFFLLTVFSAAAYCGAVTIEPIYGDAEGSGFNDASALTEEQRELFGAGGNYADTLGQARKNAFEHAAGLLGGRLPGSNVIRVEVSFSSFENETTVAKAYIGKSISFGPGLLHIGYPSALAEKIREKALIDESEPHFTVEFSRNSKFHYGLRGEAPPYSIDFVALAAHEIIHGLGFHSSLREDGSFPDATLDVSGGNQGSSVYVEQWQRIYDVQMYSEEDREFITDLEQQDRERAITSGTGLLWDGTARPGKENDPCSYGRRMAELKPAGVAPDGKPRLYAPPTFEEGSSVTHVHPDAEDIMEYLYPFPMDMDLSLAMLKDMGWDISDAAGFPPSCAPTGISVTPTSGLVTTEGGGEAVFRVKLESEPASKVVIPLRSSDPSEGTADVQALEFTPGDWEAEQTVTVTGADDGDGDGPGLYAIVLEPAESGDRFYNGFDPDDVSLINEDNDPQAAPPLPGDSSSGPTPTFGGRTEQGGGGCALAPREDARNTPGSGAFALFPLLGVLVFAVPGNGPRGEKRILAGAGPRSDRADAR